MRVYSRAMGTTNWNTLEAYLDAPTVRWYGAGSESGQDYAWLAGHWLSGLVPPPSGTMVYEDAFGLRVGGDLGTAAVTNRVPEYLELNPDVPDIYLPEEPTLVNPMSLPIIVLGCLAVCAASLAFMWNAYHICATNPPPVGCAGAPHWVCWPNCLAQHGCGGPVSLVVCLGCALCVCVALRLPPKVCRSIAEHIRKKMNLPKPKKYITGVI